MFMKECNISFFHLKHKFCVESLDFCLVVMKEVVTAVFWSSLGCFIIFTTRGEENTLFINRRNETQNWTDALTICSETQNSTMASFHYFSNSNVNLNIDLRDLRGSSAWLYGIEVISDNLPFLVGSAPEDESLKGLCLESLNPNTTTWDMTKDPFSYNESNQRCKGKGKGTLMTVEYATIRHVKGLYAEAYLGQPFWIGEVNQAQLIQNDDIKTRCLLLDGDGQLRSDNCSNQHRVICTSARLKPTLTYLDSSATVKPYNPSTATPQTESTVTLETGTPTRVATTNDITTDITRGHISSSQPPTEPVSTMHTDTSAHDSVTQYGIVFGSVAVLIVIIAIGICCWACRRKSKQPGAEPKLSEVYSDTADSIVIGRVGGPEEKNTDYATPEDAIAPQRALPRTSVSSDAYDVLNEPIKHKYSSKEKLNVYSHVQIVQEGAAAGSDNTYDVTSHHKNKITAPKTKDEIETYGNVRT